MSAFATALTVESKKLRRSLIARVVTPLVTVVIPLASIGSVALARQPDLPGTAAAKFGVYATGPLAQAHLEVCAQILSVALIVAGGFSAAWCFGREFTEGLAGALCGLAVPRTSIATAKAVVLATWLIGCTIVAVAATVLLSVVLGGDVAAAAREVGTALVAGVLSVGLATPFGWVATLTRSALGTAGVLIGVVAVTQVVVVLGAGSWFPYAVPSLWAGAGGPHAADSIAPAALVLTAAVAPLGVLLVRTSWGRLTNV